MDKGKNFQSGRGATSLPPSDPEKQCRKPPPPPPGAIAAAAAAIAAAAATAAGKDLRPKFAHDAKLKHKQDAKAKSCADILKQLRTLSIFPNNLARSLEEPSTSSNFPPLDLMKTTAQVKPSDRASTSSSSQPNQATVRQHGTTTHKRKRAKLTPSASTDSSFPPNLNSIPSSGYLKIAPRAPVISQSPQLNSPEANLNAWRNAAASNLSSLFGHISPSSNMPTLSNPYHSAFPTIDYPLFGLQQTGNQRIDVRSAEQAQMNNQVMMPHRFPLNALQHPIPFPPPFASYNAGMQHSFHLPPLLSYLQQNMNFPNCCARDISSMEQHHGMISKINFSPNLYLAMKLLISALRQADNYIIGHCGCSICDFCGEKFSLYVLFMEHIIVHCCKILENEKHNFVIWNSFAADYLSVVGNCIPNPCEIMLAMERQRTLQNPTTSNMQQSDPNCSQGRKRKASNLKKNKRVTESDGRSSSTASENEVENLENEARTNSDKQKPQMPAPGSMYDTIIERCLRKLL